MPPRFDGHTELRRMLAQPPQQRPLLSLKVLTTEH